MTTKPDKTLSLNNPMTIALDALDKVCGGAETFNDRWKNSMQDIAASQPLEYSNPRYRERVESALIQEGQRRLQERR